MMAKMIRWTDEELLLALEVMHRRAWRGGNTRTQEFIELSKLLRRVNFPKADVVQDNFRSVASVVYKAGNLVGANPELSGGFKATKREAELLAEYIEDPQAVLNRAQLVHEKLARS